MSIYVQRISSLTSHLESPCANLIVYLWRFEGILPQSTRNIWRVVTAVHRSSGPFLLVIIDSGVMAVWVTARETHNQRWCWVATSMCSWCACNIGSSGSSDSLFAGHLHCVRVYGQCDRVCRSSVATFLWKYELCDAVMLRVLIVDELFGAVTLGNELTCVRSFM